MRTNQRSIAWMMWIVGIVALYLALAREGPRGYWLRLSLFAAAGGIAVLGFLWLVSVPTLARTLARGDPDRERRILSWVVQTPFFGRRKALARYLLGLNCQLAKRYEEAESLYRAILTAGVRHLDPGFEAMVRKNLADTIDSLGRREEADAERKRAAAPIRGTARSFLAWQAQGDLQKRAHRYPEAYEAYERALDLGPPKTVRIPLMLLLASTALNCGRPIVSLHWATATIKMKPRGPHRATACQYAALACSSLNRVEEALAHARLAAQVASTAIQRALALVLVAQYTMRRGDLDGALIAAREAEALAPGKSRAPATVIAHVAMERGRLSEAIDGLERVASIAETHDPTAERRITAAHQAQLATLQAELGNRSVALDLLRRAELDARGDAKFTVHLDIAAALVHAFCNERELALDRMRCAFEGCDQMQEDTHTQKVVLSRLARAALLIDQPETAETLLREYFELKPDPLYYPYLYYHLAECRRRLGDPAGARELDMQAASTHYGTRWESLARARLGAATATV